MRGLGKSRIRGVIRFVIIKQCWQGFADCWREGEAFCNLKSAWAVVEISIKL